MIELKNLTKTYYSHPIGTKIAVDDVSLSFPRGQIVGLFGENGAGKTTMLKCILNLLRHKGEITLDGQPISRENIHQLSFATCEHSFFPSLDANGHRDFYAEHFPNFNHKRFDGLMEFFELPKKKVISSFSTGQKNQFEVIMALCQGADYILMDEPFAGNDVFNREDFYKVLLGILEPHETVLLSTHLIEEVSDFIGRALLLRHGEIIADVTADEIAEKGRTLMEFVKENYRYKSDRVSRALGDLTDME